MLDRFVGEIGARARLVAAHAREEGDDGPELEPEAATGDSAYPT
jgi:hypothetical protein